MAKGNGILGFASGALGSIVFSRVKGQQIMKGRNNKPHNPRTRKQILHRSKLSNLYKFTRLLPPGCLVGAFEDQRPRENWQSAFIRHNVKNSVCVLKDWVEDETKPPTGPFIMSYGSIVAQMCSWWMPDTELPEFVLGYNTHSRLGITKIGELSANMIARYGLQEGDVVTFIVYDAIFPVSSRYPELNVPPRVPQFLFDSFRIDPTSEARIDSVFTSIRRLVVPSDNDSPTVWWGLQYSISFQPAIAIVVTRSVGNRTIANTAPLLVPNPTGDPWAYYNSELFLKAVLRTWGMSREAILAGGPIVGDLN